MRPIDMHCDTILGLIDDKGGGLGLYENNLSVDIKKN